ncbi:hypothetical protein, partial [Chryseobacterium sp. CH1]|uniref:hypothetical protein n=1 Tax=Chryseobacterium sp. CH1 TaxID=713551 RepID=UPI001E4ED9CE
MGYKARYDIHWIDDCHYQLKNRKVIKSKSPEEKCFWLCISGITVIDRSSKFQIETNEKMGYKARYDIHWIDDCHYQLK